jgi:hypothetical protein
LRYGYVIKADEVIKDSEGKVIELRCSYDPETLGKNPEGRKVRGVIHWVSARHAKPALINLYEPLFTVDFPDAKEADYHELINPQSLVTRQGFVESGLAQATDEQRFQFEREGYFVWTASTVRKMRLCSIGSSGLEIPGPRLRRRMAELIYIWINLRTYEDTNEIWTYSGKHRRRIG